MSQVVRGEKVASLMDGLNEGPDESLIGDTFALDILARLRDSALEDHHREHAVTSFYDLIDRAVPLSDAEIVDLLDSVEESGLFTRGERRDVLFADLIVRGRRWEDGQELYLVVEVSIGIGISDVERAARRAGLLSRIRPALPVVAGERALPDAVTAAREAGVWRLLGGTAIPPAAR